MALGSAGLPLTRSGRTAVILTGQADKRVDYQKGDTIDAFTRRLIYNGKSIVKAMDAN